MAEYSPKLFLDCCVLADIAEDPYLFQSAYRFVKNGSYTLVISSFLLLELRSHRLSPQAIKFISSLPFVIAETSDVILGREAQLYPMCVELPTGYSSVDWPGKPEELCNVLLEHMDTKIREFETTFKKEKETIWFDIKSRVQRFAASNPSGIYTPSEVWIFLEDSVLRMLASEDLQKITNEANGQHYVEINCFKSALLQSSAIFFEYCIQRKQGKPSDLGDFYHLAYLPYCDLSVVDSERNDLIRRLVKQGWVAGIDTISLAQFKDLCLEGKPFAETHKTPKISGIKPYEIQIKGRSAIDG